MFRRCVSVLLIAGFLASQLAVIPHAHRAASAAERQRHNATPHFHCEWFGHAGHNHGHSHPGHGHSHPGPQHEGTKPASDNSGGQPLGTGLSGVDHDTDAIFLPSQAAVVSNVKVQVVAAWELALLARIPDWLSDLQASPGPLIQWHPPDAVLDDSDSYLTLRNLRI